MAPKRRSRTAGSDATGTRQRRSKLAKENDISNEQEAEIREAFELFAMKGVAGFEQEKEGVLRVEDVRRCLIALGLSVKQGDLAEIRSTLDPVQAGYVPYSPFLSYAAIHLHHSDVDPEAQDDEMQAAYNLFTQSKPGPITLTDLRRVARTLREQVSDDILKDMIVEANGEGKDGWRRGVTVEDFEAVMRRAGVFA